MAETTLGPFPIQVAHRLTQLPGKCQNIHGHSMEVQVHFPGLIRRDGYYYVHGEILDFSAAKKIIRDYLDNEYDHKLHLNEDDPWAQPLEGVGLQGVGTLPGLVTHHGDPSVENIAFWICKYLDAQFRTYIEVTVHETKTNSVTCGSND